MLLGTTDLLREAREATEYILKRYARVGVAKALDPNKPKDYLVIEKRLKAALAKVAEPEEGRTLRAAIDALDVDWPNIGDAQRDQIVAAAKAALAPRASLFEAFEHEFALQGTALHQDTKASAQKKFKLQIPITLDEPDRRAIAAAAVMHTNYVRDGMGKRQEALSGKAREVVAAGMAAGFSRDVIMGNLRTEMSAAGLERSDNYWRVIASSFAGRGRTYANLSSMQAGGVTRYTFDAVLDEVTSTQCRFMHGRSFSVSEALARYDEANAAEDPEEVQFIQPWMNVGKDDDGEYLYFKNKAGERQTVARVTDNGKGKVDDRGSYSDAMSEKDLSANGITNPPCHGNCRSTILVDESAPMITPAGAFTPQAPPAGSLVDRPGRPVQVMPWFCPVDKQGRIQFTAAVCDPVTAFTTGKSPVQAPLDALADLTAQMDNDGQVPIGLKQLLPKGIKEVQDKWQTIQDMLAAQKKDGNTFESMKKAFDSMKGMGNEKANPGLVEEYIKNPKLLAGVEVLVVQMTGGTNTVGGYNYVVVSGYEAVLAGKLLGKQIPIKMLQVKKFEKMQAEKAQGAVATAPKPPPPPSPPPAPVTYGSKFKPAYPTPAQEDAGELPDEDEDFGGPAPEYLTPPATPKSPVTVTTPLKVPPVVFGKTPTPVSGGPSYEGMSLNGVTFKPVSKPKFWETTKDVDLGEGPLQTKTKLSSKLSGTIIIEPDGRMWIVKPKVGFDYQQTFPKGKEHPGLTLQQSALKNVYERSGLEVEIVGHVGDFTKTSSNSCTRYYLATRKGGQPWDANQDSTNVQLVTAEDAEILLNTAIDKEVLKAVKVHLDALKAGKKPAPVLYPAPPAPPPPKLVAGPATDENFLHQKDGGTAGSNTGGFYTGKDGIARYAKFYKDSAKAQGEVLAANLYRELGLAAPDCATFDHKPGSSTAAIGGEGKFGFASVLLEGQTMETAGITKENAREFMKGFVADVLIGNGDAAGMKGDNAFILKNGTVARIDNGNAFMSLTSTRQKPRACLKAIDEWEAYFDPKKNPTKYPAIAKAAGYKSPEDFKHEVVRQISAVVKLREKYGSWEKFIDAHAPGLEPADRRDMIDMMEARTLLLIEKMEALKPKPGEAWRADPLDGVAPHKALTVEDLKPAALTLRQKRLHPTSDVVPGTDLSPEAFKLQGADRLKKISASSKSGIKAFTDSSYGAIRDEELDFAKGKSPTPGKRSQSISEGYSQVPAEPRTVWRKIQGLRADAINAIIQNTGVTRLGIGNTPATSSSSYDTGVATNWGGDIKGASERNMHLLYQINQRSAMYVEPISSNPSEREVLIPREAEFRIIGVSHWPGNKYGVIVELEEI